PRTGLVVRKWCSDEDGVARDRDRRAQRLCAVIDELAFVSPSVTPATEDICRTPGIVGKRSADHDSIFGDGDLPAETVAVPAIRGDELGFFRPPIPGPPHPRHLPSRAWPPA